MSANYLYASFCLAVAQRVAVPGHANENEGGGSGVGGVRSFSLFVRPLRQIGQSCQMFETSSQPAL
jgi:hypothetical protein